MKKRDAFPFCADPGCFVDEANAGCATSFEGSIQIVDREADVVNSGAALGNEAADRRLGRFRFEELDEGITRSESGDRRPIGIVQLYFRKLENIAIEREDLGEGPYRDANMRDLGSPTGGWLAHGALDVGSART